MPIPRLWGRSSPIPAALAESLADLDRLMADRPELTTPGRQLAGLLRAAFEETSLEVLPDLTSSGLAASWREGVAAFRAAPPPLDLKGIERRSVAICRALRPANPAATPLETALRRGSLDLGACWGDVLSGRAEEIARRVEPLGVAPELAASVLRLSLLPPLSRFSEALDALRLERDWNRGDCPNCGSPPALAESRGLEQRRVLRCGLCASAWPGERLRCPFCGESDHRALHYFFVEGEQDRYRLARCDSCGLDIKVVSTLSPLSPAGLLVTELATVHLDSIPDVAPEEDSGAGTVPEG